MQAGRFIWGVAGAISLFAALVSLASFATGARSLDELRVICNEHSTRNIAVSCALAQPIRSWVPEGSRYQREFYTTKLVALWSMIFGFSVVLGIAQGNDGPEDWGWKHALGSALLFGVAMFKIPIMAVWLNNRAQFHDNLVELLFVYFMLYFGGIMLGLTLGRGTDAKTGN